MHTSFVRTYMKDHLAGARVALDLLHALTTAAADPEWRRFFSVLHSEIDEDKRTLERLLHDLGGGRGVVRQAAGRVAARAGRLKLQIDDPAQGTFERFQSLEALALGSQGKLALWRALDEIAPGLPALRTVDLHRLMGRAEDQYARVEGRRLEAAAALLHRGEDGDEERPGRTGGLRVTLLGLAVAAAVAFAAAGRRYGWAEPTDLSRG